MLRPVAAPINCTSASRATIAMASGQGWLSRHVPSISLAAIPASRTWGPSSHHTGPSPSQTRTGVQVNSSPAGITGTEASKSNMLIIRRLPRRGPGQGRDDTPDRLSSMGPRLPLVQQSSWDNRRCPHQTACWIATEAGAQTARDGNDSRLFSGCCGNLAH